MKREKKLKWFIYEGYCFDHNIEQMINLKGIKKWRSIGFRENGIFVFAYLSTRRIDFDD